VKFRFTQPKAHLTTSVFLLVLKAKIQVIITKRTRVNPGFFVGKLSIVGNREQGAGRKNFPNYQLPITNYQ
jgi:hypothetical protein